MPKPEHPGKSDEVHGKPESPGKSGEEHGKGDLEVLVALAVAYISEGLPVEGIVKMSVDTLAALKAAVVTKTEK